MNETIRFLERHGYALLFAFVFAEQMGLPIPALPVLLAMGALAGVGRFSPLLAVAVATLAALAADFFWYELGRRRGHPVLSLLCRISLEPDSCVRRTEVMFSNKGARALVFAKFVPGLSTVAPPLAGVVRMPLLRFLLLDAAGALLWVATFLGLGYAFRGELERIAAPALRMGGWLFVLLVGGLAAYIAWKYIERQRFLRKLRVARITPEELMGKITAGEPVVVVDLRHALEASDGDGAVKLPGAIRLSPDEIELRHTEIPRDRDIILYCT